ncbi:hypothetical protein IWQ61_009758 [Dispira simplex]|nr:hypothetical protein IWQ61_009758 [Dispira simplex]
MRPSGSRPAPVLKLNPDGDVELPSDSGLHYSSFVYPFCEHCIHGIYKPSVVFFGENIASELKDTVADWIRQAEATLVIGSSLTTYSAFRLVQLAHSLQHSICILNRGATQGDGLATLRLDNSCGEVMSLVSTIVANFNTPEDRL